MKKVSNFTIVVLLLIILLLGNNASAEITETNISIVIDNYNLVSFPDQKPYVDNNYRTLVPVRFISQELGASVDWDNISREVSIIFEGKLIVLPVNNQFAKIYENSSIREVNIGTEAIIKDGRVMVPLRFVSEALGSIVVWDEKRKTVFIERIAQVRPNENIINEFTDLDEDISNLISTKSNYSPLITWDRKVTVSSRGRFTDYVTMLDSNQFEDVFYFEFDSSESENISWISIYFSTDMNQNNYYYFDITPDVMRNNGYLTVNKDDFLVGEGNPTWERIKYFRIAMQSQDSKSSSIIPKELSTFDSYEPMITLWFDDGWEDNYTNAYKIISRVEPSIKGTIGLIGTRIGQDRYLSDSQIKELKKDDWEFVNHSYTHPDLTTLTDDEVRNEIVRNFNIVSKYDPIGAYHFVVPYSSVDNKVLSVIEENSLSARYRPESPDHFPINRHDLGFYEVTNKTDFKTVRNIIDNAIENKSWVGLLFHRIEDPANDRYSYGTQQFEQLIYYLSFRKKDIEVVTPSEVFDILGMPISIE